MLQTRVSLTKIFILAGAGYILHKNGKLSDILVELRSQVKALQNYWQKSCDSDAIVAEVGRLSHDTTLLNKNSDAMVAQAHCSSHEIRQLPSTRNISVLNRNFKGGKMAHLIIVPAALGASGYCFMRWKGITFSDLLWATKRKIMIPIDIVTKCLDPECELEDGAPLSILILSMVGLQIFRLQKKEIRKLSSKGELVFLPILAAALGASGASGCYYMWSKATKRNLLTRRLESVCEALSAVKKHLTQRIQKLGDKMETQKKISNRKSVEDARLDALQNMIFALDEKVGSLEYKQDRTYGAVLHLCDVVAENKADMPEFPRV